FGGGETRSRMKSGIWVEGRMHASTLPPTFAAILEEYVARPTAAPNRVTSDGVPHLLFSKRLNPDSTYPPGFEACGYSLADLEVRKQKLRWQVLGAGLMLLLVGLGGSHVFATRLSVPVEKLAVD